MQVVFDASILGRAQFLPIARSGIFRYADSLLQALADSGQCTLALTSFGYSLDAAGIVDYLHERETLKDTEVLLNPAIRFIGESLRRALRSSEKKGGNQAVQSGVLRKAHQLGDGFLASMQQAYPSLLARRLSEAQVFHTPFLHIPPALRAFPKLRRVITVQDLNPITFPEHFPPVVNRWSNRVMQNIERDDWVVTYSDFVRSQLCDRYRLSPDRVRVTPLAADASLYYPCDDPMRVKQVRKRYGIPEGPYILSLGSLAPHKNIGHLIHCFGQLLRQESLPDVNLVIAGSPGWMLDSIKTSVATLGNLANRIIQAGFVDDEDQSALYTGATAFVFPSLCEGFGLPPLEAMQCGIPVICTNATSLPEVVGTAGLLIEPFDVDALCQAILDVLRDERLRQQMIVSGIERARQFSWQRCARDTLDTYRLALATP